MNEGMYLEAMNQLQQKYNDNNMEIITVNKKILLYKKELITTYGMMRIIDNILEEEDLMYQHPVKIMVEILRANLSELTESMMI